VQLLPLWRKERVTSISLSHTQVVSLSVIHTRFVSFSLTHTRAMQPLHMGRKSQEADTSLSVSANDGDLTKKSDTSAVVIRDESSLHVAQPGAPPFPPLPPSLYLWTICSLAHSLARALSPCCILQNLFFLDPAVSRPLSSTLRFAMQVCS